MPQCRTIRRVLRSRLFGTSLLTAEAEQSSVMMREDPVFFISHTRTVGSLVLTGRIPAFMTLYSVQLLQRLNRIHHTAT